jgi:hypothetical protein
MDDADKEELAGVIAAELADSAGIATGEDRDLTARVLVARIESTLRHMGWRSIRRVIRHRNLTHKSRAA